MIFLPKGYSKKVFVKIENLKLIVEHIEKEGRVEKESFEKLINLRKDLQITWLSEHLNYKDVQRVNHYCNGSLKTALIKAA